MSIIFNDEDMIYPDRERYDQLYSIRQVIDVKKSKGAASFCKKCGHIMQPFTIGNAKLLNMVSVGNRIADMVKSD